jgi:hypothetical protein
LGRPALIDVLRLASYRFRVTFRRQWPGYLTVIVLVGAVGGLALGTLAGARRTQSSFPAYLARERASDLEVGVFPRTGAALPVNGAYYRHVADALGHLPDVKRLASSPLLFAVQMRPNGVPSTPAALDAEVDTIGSVNGMYFTQDRVVVARGRLANPARADEFVATGEAARLLGWHLGQVVPIGLFTPAQGNSPDFGTPKVKPVFQVAARLTGIVVFQDQIVRDDVDRFPTFVLFTPAFTARVPAAAVFPQFGLRLEHGSHDVAAVERAVIAALPRGSLYNFHVTSVVTGEVERAIKPETIALAVFGAIAALAAFLLAGQSIGRLLRAGAGDLLVLRSLGATQSMRRADGLMGALGAVVLGSLVAVGTAIALSFVFPIGPVSQLAPAKSAADWTVLGFGFGVLVLGLGVFAVVLAIRITPLGNADTTPAGAPRRSRAADAASRSGLSVAAVTGIRAALERPNDRGAPPVRSALLGAALAVSVVATTLTFASGLRTLVSTPRLYGWNWTYAINETGSGNIPPQTAGYLTHDADVAAWTGYGFAVAQIDGTSVPILTGDPNAPVTPPILSGHALEGNREIVLGAATIAMLHKHVGQTVTVSYGSPQNAPIYVPPTPLRIVGTATFPAIGNTGVLHPSMGTGALVSNGFPPASFKKAKMKRDPNQNGPAIIVVRLRTGVKPAVGLASLETIVTKTDEAVANDPNAGSDYRVLSVQRPAEIVNYRSTGSTPARLAICLAAGALGALALTLVASVRRRRRELALLKTLGFTRRQLGSSVGWQASVAAIVGILVGVPCGIVAGRWLWTLFARQIDAVPHPTVPTTQIILIAVGTLAFANLVAAIPARIAARTRAGVLLQAE